MSWNLPDLPTDNVTIASVANWATKVIDSLRYLKGLDGDITLEDDIITTHLVDGVDVNAHKARHEAAGGDALSAPVAIAAMPALTNGYVWKGDATNRPAEVAFPTRTLSALNDTVTEGYYAATTLSAVDADLAPANILSGITIFGKAGTIGLTIVQAIAGANWAPNSTDWVEMATFNVPATSKGVYAWAATKYKLNTNEYGKVRILWDAVQKAILETLGCVDWVGAGGAGTLSFECKQSTASTAETISGGAKYITY